jgi:hypothetical protein
MNLLKCFGVKKRQKIKRAPQGLLPVAYNLLSNTYAEELLS